MSYRLDNYDQALVIDSFEKGIAESPYAGFSDMRNINIISVPGEASVNFATASITPPAVTQGTISAVNGDVLTFTGGVGLENKMAIVFAGSLPTGLTAGKVYWVKSLSGNTFSPSNNMLTSNVVTLSSTTTGGTFTTFTMTTPKHFAYNSRGGYTWMLDDSGQAWTNTYTTTSGYWVFAGNNAGSGSTNGNGLVYYEASNQNQYIFVFRNSCIDYTLADNNSISNGSWKYGWKWTSDGSTGDYTSLKSATADNLGHDAMVAPDSRVYFCDANWIGRFYQTDPTVAFDPAIPSTYTWDQTTLLPTTDTAQCLTFLGTNILVGGKKNIIYPWDRFSTNFLYPILLPESNIVKMVTVNTNTYIFIGNRGRIYITNGSQVNLYKKIPDHISGTVEPYFSWGGATSIKNQLYFSALAITNAGSSISQYGGVWAIDIDTTAIRLTNKLSYGTYAGYASALIPNFATNPAGTGLFIGWNSGASTYGVDTTVSTPYTGSQAIIDSDLIPIGTYQQPRDFTKVEYLLTKPLASGESITIKTRLIFNTSDTGYTTTLTDSTTGNYTGISDVNFKNAIWVQFQIILNSTASSPSYTRLKELRILGLTGPTAANIQQLFS